MRIGDTRPRTAPTDQARSHAEAGQGLLEVALVLPVFLLLLLILFDFGRVIYVQNSITDDARNGVRAAVVNAGYSTTKYAEIRAAAKRSPTLVTLTDANITGAPAVTCHSVPDDPSGTCFYAEAPTGDGKPAAGSRVEVNISVSVPLITPIIAAVLGGSYQLTARSVGFVQCAGC